ncbi:MAG: CinA family protein [Bacteroidota bacterium]
MVPDSLLALAEDVVEAYRKRGWRMAVAECTTGGLFSAVMTTIPGVSAVFDRGFVVYSNEAKTEILKVEQDLMIQHGAVSQEVVQALAQGILTQTQVDWAIAETGIAGPQGGTPEKPVGTTYLALTHGSGKIETRTFIFKGDRRSIRVQIVSAMLDWILELSTKSD